MRKRKPPAATTPMGQVSPMDVRKTLLQVSVGGMRSLSQITPLSFIAGPFSNPEKKLHLAAE
jgi:hypothetical protein